ncbi:unnamed protein product [Parajaminaea phylloscopi]
MACRSVQPAILRLRTQTPPSTPQWALSAYFAGSSTAPSGARHIISLSSSRVPIRFTPLSKDSKGQDRDDKAMRRKNRKASKRASETPPPILSGTMVKGKEVRARSESEAIREQRFLLSQNLVRIRRRVLERNMTALNGFEQALAMVNGHPKFEVKYRTLIYNQLIELCAMAGKGKRTLELYLEMKKRGRHPDLSTYGTILNGLYDIHIDPLQSTAMMQSIDALYHEFDQLRQEALSAGGTKRMDRQSQGISLAARDRLDADEDETESESGPSNFASERMKVIHHIETDPCAVESVIAAYVRLMVKLGKQDVAWTVMSRMSDQWQVTRDGYPRLTRQVVGTWMYSYIMSSLNSPTEQNIEPSADPEKSKSREKNNLKVSEEQVAKVIAIWQKWRSMILQGAPSVLASYRTVWRRDEEEKARVASDWKRTLPSSRQLQDLVQLARGSRSPQLSDLALECLADFSSLPLPAGLGDKAGASRASLPREFLDPTHPLYMLSDFPLTRPASKPNSSSKAPIWAATMEDSSTDSPRRGFSVHVPQDGNTGRSQRHRLDDPAYDHSAKPMFLGFLLGELMHVVPLCTLPQASEVFGTVMMSVAEQELAKATPAQNKPLGYGGLYSRLSRQVATRNALHSHGYWGRALDSAASAVQAGKNPRHVIQRILDIITTMRRLYRRDLMSDPPDDQNYHCAMLHVSRQIGSGRVGPEQLQHQAKLGRWWLEDRVEASKTTAAGRHGWLPWVEFNGGTFAGTTLKCYHILSASERRMDRILERARTRLERTSKRQMAAGAASKATEAVEAGTAAKEAPETSEAVEMNESRKFVIDALKTWRSSLSARPEDKANPFSYMDDIPFPPHEMVLKPGPATSDPRSKEERMPNLERWTAIAKTFLVMLRVALDSGPKDPNVLPEDLVITLKAMQQRCRDFLAIVEPRDDPSSTTEQADAQERDQSEDIRGERRRADRSSQAPGARAVPFQHETRRREFQHRSS